MKIQFSRSEEICFWRSPQHDLSGTKLSQTDGQTQRGTDRDVQTTRHKHTF